MTGLPYLGSKISLISKSEIRYEGILYTIDTKESTIALAKVRSFGTEGRPTDRPVVPRDEVYEYIIFKASDIKDLHICEGPKSFHGLSHDPAIVQHSPPIPLASLSYGQPYSSLCGLPPFQHYPAQTSFPHIPQSFFTSTHHSGSSRSTTPSSQRKSPTSDAGVQVSVDREFEDSKHDQDQTKFRDRNQVLQSAQRMPLRPPQISRRGGPRRRGRGRINGPFETLKFDAEYDFEKANAEFQELENKLSKNKIEESGLENAPPEIEMIGAYDRKKSFFDDISCEATQRSKGLPRFDWRIERKLNVETFGVSLSDTWMRRRRGRGGYRRGRARYGNEPIKTVTFDETPAIKEVELQEEQKPKEIPVIEIIVDKEKEWPENGDKGATAWP